MRHSTITLSILGGPRDAGHPPRREPPHRNPQRGHDHARLTHPGRCRAGGLAGRHAAGPVRARHAIDTEQVWAVLDGGASVELDGQLLTVAPGDTLILPANAPRRITADPQAGLAAIAAAPAGTRAYTLDGTRVGADCAVPDGDKLIPAWVA